MRCAGWVGGWGGWGVCVCVGGGGGGASGIEGGSWGGVSWQGADPHCRRLHVQRLVAGGASTASAGLLPSLAVPPPPPPATPPQSRTSETVVLSVGDARSVLMRAHGHEEVPEDMQQVLRCAPGPGAALPVWLHDPRPARRSSVGYQPLLRGAPALAGCPHSAVQAVAAKRCYQVISPAHQLSLAPWLPD